MILGVDCKAMASRLQCCDRFGRYAIWSSER